MSRAKVNLVLIDPQQDFLGNADGSPYSITLSDGTVLTASLPVPGAVEDMNRLSDLIDRLTDKLSGIQVTMDSHRTIDVAHPAMWRNSQGRMPDPFTIISHADVENGVWFPRNPGFRARMLDYTAKLEANGNYPLMIWPEHCLIGTWGHNVYSRLAEALQRWERKRFASVDYVTKGTNIFTEHYGALMAEVPDPSDPTTQLNAGFLQVLQDSDVVGLGGEAELHCVKATISQIANNIGDEHLKKCYILTDCMSPVMTPGVDVQALSRKFFSEMEQRGMTLTTSTEFLT